MQQKISLLCTQGHFIEVLRKLIGHTICSCWGSERTVTVHDLAPHATSITKLQHGLCNTSAPCPNKKTDRARVNTGHRRFFVENINSNSSSFIKSSHKKASISRSQFPPTVLPIRHQELKCSPQSFSDPSSPVSIENAPLCQFFLATNHPSTKCVAIPPQPCETLIYTSDSSLPSIAIHARCYTIISPSDVHHRHTVHTDDLTFGKRLKHAPPTHPQNAPPNY